MIKIVLLVFMSTLTFVSPVSAKQIIDAVKVLIPPVIDGVGDDKAWELCQKKLVQDVVAQIPIEIQVAYSSEFLFVKVRFPDDTENRKHKMLNWDPQLRAYKTGPLREDSFVIKWSMEPVPVDISLASETPYRADIWFWKAFRSDPVGYADDKLHSYSRQQTKKFQRIMLDNGQVMFLSRSADEGKSSYKSIAYKKFQGDSVVRYKHRQPEGSRGDVRAKGVWKDGFWTIEFKRNLNTGNDDDLRFNTNFSYLFGLSRYEIAGKAINNDIEQPNYESGDIGEILELHFLK